MPTSINMDTSPPTDDINPYEVLGVAKSATAAEIKTAYKKLALQQHPDKVAEPSRPAAHIAFQTLAHAYALLSSPHLRTRYDTTGNTSVSSSTDFNWSDFYQTQYADLVTPSAITTFAAKYKNSPEERQDVLTAYTKYAGNLGKLYESVVLSNPLEDEDRFREYIDDAINTGKVQRYKAYDAETDRQKENRMKKARKEHKRFEKANLKPTDKNAGPTALQALIQNRHKPAAAASFLENLEAKYAGGRAGKKRKAAPEPPEAAFAATAARARKTRAPSVEEAKYAGGSAGKKRKAAPEPPEAAFAATAARARKTGAPSVEEEVAGEDDEEWEGCK